MGRGRGKKNEMNLNPTNRIKKKETDVASDRFVLNNRRWQVGNIVFSSAEDILYRLIQIIGYGLGTGFSEALRGSRDLIWWIIMIIMIIVAIRIIGWTMFGVDKHAVVRDVESGNVNEDDAWREDMYTTLDFYEGVALWFLGGMVSDWVVNIENNGRFVKSQYLLPVLVIPIFIKMVSSLFRGKKVTKVHRA